MVCIFLSCSLVCAVFSYLDSNLISVSRFCFFFFLMFRRPPSTTRTDTLFPYPTLFRSHGNGTACRAVATQEGRLSFGEHPPAVFLARVPGRVTDDHHPAGLHAAQRLAQRGLSVLAVVEGGVEHGGVELVVRERKLAKAGLEAREQRWQSRAVMTRSTHSVAVVGEQVDRAWEMAGKRQPVTHPAIACTKVQDHGPGTRTGSGQQVPQHVVVAAGPDMPLPGVPAGCVHVREAQVEIPAFAAAALRLPDPFVRSEEHTSELQSLMRISYAVFCLKKKKNTQIYNT